MCVIGLQEYGPEEWRRTIRLFCIAASGRAGEDWATCSTLQLISNWFEDGVSGRRLNIINNCSLINSVWVNWCCFGQRTHLILIQLEASGRRNEFINFNRFCIILSCNTGTALIGRYSRQHHRRRPPFAVNYAEKTPSSRQSCKKIARQNCLKWKKWLEFQQHTEFHAIK